MQSLNAYAVVEQMTTELATRRGATARRRAAYLALARVIVYGDEPQDSLGTPGLTQAPRCDWESAAAA